MKNRTMCFLSFLGLVVFFHLTLFALAQAGGQRAPGTTAAPQAAPATNANLVDVNGKKFDPHDLSGIWIRRGGNRAFGPPNSWPPLTKAGEDAIKTRIPSRVTAAILSSKRSTIRKKPTIPLMRAIRKVFRGSCSTPPTITT